MGMEYAIADWSLGQVARKEGFTEDYNYFDKRGKYYKNYFDAQTGFARGRVNDNTWRTPFNPFTSIHRQNDYTEGNAWQYTWLVPQDVEGLIKLYGSEKAFTKKLDSLFVAKGDLGSEASPDISGLIGQYAHAVVRTFKEQQRKDGLGPYKFQRKTEKQLDTQSNDGYGSPVKPVGLIVSTFRPSDDASTFGFLIPSNLFAVKSLKQLAEILRSVKNDTAFANECEALADEVMTAINKYAIIEHPKYGKIYAYEIDGFGGVLLMDDANVPGLLSLPYLDCVSVNDEIYQNTRKFVWSEDNPYFFKGTAGEGIGGPHGVNS